MEAHEPEPHRPVAQVGAARGGHRVVVDVDDVVEHAHGGGDRALQPLVIQGTVIDVGGEVHRAQVAHGDLVVRGVEGDLGAEIGAVHHAGVLLRRAQVARILEGDPRVAGLEQHGEHAPPQLHRRYPPGGTHLPALRRGLVVAVACLEGLAGEVVQVRDLVRGEQCPLPLLVDALHEQVRHPAGGVHVVGTATLVAGVLAQLEEVLDVPVPDLQVRTHRALALAALVHRDGGVVGDLEEGHHALGGAVGATDVRPHRPHPGPVVAEPAGELG
ncbi:hypothetical protein KBTX_02998 [wastewater metagenome]|uniref:Uncharacterized protein n=2 Tax=unclassified sequences TaxID=12908 RepID=A0A5B8RFN9_9ZZZZ|nr:hypothetical protein KBTEX_02998 [uncultured organism]